MIACSSSSWLLTSASSGGHSTASLDSGHGLASFRDRLEHRLQVDQLRARRLDAGLGPRQREESLRDAIEPPRLALDVLDETVALGLVLGACLENFDCAQNRRERALQLVSGIRDEFPLRPVPHVERNPCRGAAIRSVDLLHASTWIVSCHDMTSIPRKRRSSTSLGSWGLRRPGSPDPPRFSQGRSVPADREGDPGPRARTAPAPGLCPSTLPARREAARTRRTRPTVQFARPILFRATASLIPITRGTLHRTGALAAQAASPAGR